MNAIMEAYAQVCAEIAKLVGVKEALEKAGAVLGRDGGQMAVIGNGRATKAPDGALRAAILGVLDGKQAKGNGAIRAELAAGGYKWSLSPLHVTKTLIALRLARKVKKVGAGPRVAYLKAKP